MFSPVKNSRRPAVEQDKESEGEGKLSSWGTSIKNFFFSPSKDASNQQAKEPMMSPARRRRGDASEFITSSPRGVKRPHKPQPLNTEPQPSVVDSLVHPHHRTAPAPRKLSFGDGLETSASYSPENTPSSPSERNGLNETVSSTRSSTGSSDHIAAIRPGRRRRPSTPCAARGSTPTETLFSPATYFAPSAKGVSPSPRASQDMSEFSVCAEVRYQRESDGLGLMAEVVAVVAEEEDYSGTLEVHHIEARIMEARSDSDIHVGHLGDTVDLCAPMALSEPVKLACGGDSGRTQPPAIDISCTETDAMVATDANDTQMDEVEEEFDPYIFIRNLPPLPDWQRRRPSALPRKLRHSPKVTLVLDLDETLVHCSTESVPHPDMVFPVEYNLQVYQVFVKKRPHFQAFLEAVAQDFEVIVFTASQKAYAQTLLDLLDPDRRLMKYRLYRDSCVNIDGNYLKDLNILGRDLSKVIIVDNSPQAYGYQIDNGVPIESWFDDPGDSELLKLIPFLKSMVDVDDVRPVLRDRFRAFELVNNVQR